MLITASGGQIMENRAGIDSFFEKSVVKICKVRKNAYLCNPV